MPKIKIEIDISSEEIKELLLGLLRTKAPSKKPVLDGATKKRIQDIKDKRPKKKKASKGNFRKTARKGGWSRQETAWLEAWIATYKQVGKDVVKRFEKQFGYKRSFSSISGKAFVLRKKMK